MSTDSAIRVVNDTEEGRAFLQERLALFTAVLAAVSFAFWVLLVAMQLPMRPGGLPTMQSLAGTMHVLQVVVLVAIRASLSRSRGTTTLYVFDAIAIVLSSVAFGAMAVLGHDAPRPAALRAYPQAINMMPAITATILIFLGRAILVPSTAKRTAALAGAMTVILSIASAIVFKRHLPPPVASTWPMGGVYSAMWCVTAGILGVVASAVLYKLQARARIADELGQYRLEEKIGEGGMGVVYRASHALLRRPTAVKLLPRDRAGEHTIARFEKEVQLTSRLTHPNTIAIYDFGRTPDGVFYYAMEYVDGLDLEDLVRRDGPMPASRVVHVLTQVCGALDEAHAVGLIHRDIKPANILLCERARAADVVKVVDFGLVKEIEGANADARVSALNTIVGTPLYLSPEAILTPGDLDARSDLYAVGCVAYFLLTGAPPFGGTTALEVFAKHMHGEPEPPSRRCSVPAALEALILECLAKDRERRPDSARTLRKRLDACGLDPWTDDDARGWWSERGTALRESRATVSPSNETLAVDLSQRV